MQLWIETYLLIINLTAFFVCGLDKCKARAGVWRVPEATLLLLAVLGGSIGFLGGMLLFRHKTRKPKFFLGVPLILVAQLAAVWLYVRR